MVRKTGHRFLIPVGMIALGVALGATAYGMPGAGSGAPVRNGGTFRISQWATIDFVDPALAYSAGAAPYLEATCAKLMNHPDTPLPAGLGVVPEVAAGYPKVSPDGRRYTFTLRRGFRFSNGTAVTARSFARAIERLLDPNMRSPAVESGYVQDIVGADDVLSRKASSPSGVVARRNRLAIRLEHPVPDFTARLAMPFFCAVSPGLPADPEGARAYASAGPYYVAAYQPGRRLVLRENRFYHGRRPHHVDRFEVDLTPSTPAEMIARIGRGQADWGVMDGRARLEQGRALVRKYGVNRSRLFLRPSPILRYFVLNTERPLFRNARLRRAVNYAVNRAAVVREYGYLAVRPSDQYLPIGFPGFKDGRIYPLKGNLRRARSIARGSFRGRKAVLYTAEITAAISMAQIVKRNLANLGLDVEIKAFPFAALFSRLAAPGEPFDIAWTPGWGADYSDPYTFINVLLQGRSIGGQNWARFNSPTYNRRMDHASRLSGPKRYRSYGDLDIALARDAAPLIAYGTDNAWTFVSNRLDPRCRILRPDLDLAAVCLKR